MLASTIAIMVVKKNAGQTNNSSQSKLLMLICTRTINGGLKYYLGTELLDQSSKLWDVIVKHTKDLDVEITECRN
jgi:hypothetical protein